MITLLGSIITKPMTMVSLLEQDPAATEEAASFGGKREVLAEKGQGGATTP